MARILICHVPKDGSTARELGGALMGRGHFVSFDGEPDAHRADRFARLRQFEAVIVVWTESSYQSAGLAHIARESLPLNVLIPVRSEDLAVGRIPLMFRKLNMFAPRDFDGLARLVARLSTAATSLKEIAEHAAKFEAEPRRELPPIVPKPPKKLQPPPLPEELDTEPEPEPVRAAAAAPVVYAPLPPPIISAAHAQYTARTPVYFDLPDVSEDVEAFAVVPEVVPQPVRSAPVAPPPPQPPIVSKPVPPVFVTRSAKPAVAAMSHPLVPPHLAPHVPAAAPPSEMQRLRAASPPNAHKVEHHAPPAPPQPTPEAPQPNPYSAIANAQDLSDAVEAGLLLHYIPEMMWLGEAGTVEVRLDRNVLEQYFGSADPSAGASAVERLSLSLYGTADAFEIERLSERTQFVGGTGIVGEGSDRWEWQVTPRKPGTQDLVVRVSALLLDRHGVPAPVALPDRRFRVDVEIRNGARVMSSLAGWRRR